jgi:hypothetical protein
MSIHRATSVARWPVAASVARWMDRPEVRAALLATLALRLLTSAVAALMPLWQPALYPWRDPLLPDHFHLAHYPPGLPHPAYGPLEYLTLPWNRWDTIWYLDIAQHGYAKYGTSAFLPLYPGMIRLLAPALGGNFLVAALVISTISAFAALVALFRLAERLAPVTGAGSFSVLVAVTMPTAFFLMAGYTEALFLALSLWAILAALDGAWWRFVALGALAALTRQQGMLLALMPLWSLAADRWSRHPRQRVGAWPGRFGAARAAATGAPPLAYALWLVALGVFWHAPPPWVPLGAARGWGLRVTWPGSGVLADLAVFVRPGGVPLGVALAAALDLGAIGIGAGLLAAAARRFPLAVVVYLAVSLLASLMKVEPSGLTTSEARYMLALLPLAVLPGLWLAHGGRARRIGWLALCAPVQVFLLMAFVLNVWVP